MHEHGDNQTTVLGQPSRNMEGDLNDSIAFLACHIESTQNEK